MKVILFGATGMVGQGCLRECLRDPGVESVLAVGRRPSGQLHAKLREIVHDDFLDYSAIELQLAGSHQIAANFTLLPSGPCSPYTSPGKKQESAWIAFASSAAASSTAPLRSRERKMPRCH
jgi:putative NADH-flavin reductase